MLDQIENWRIMFGNMTIQGVQQLTKQLPFFIPHFTQSTPHHPKKKKYIYIYNLGNQLGEVQSHQQMHMYVVAFHPKVMSHVPRRCECRHISDYFTCKLSRAVLTPFLSYDFIFFIFYFFYSQQSKDVADRLTWHWI